MLPIIVPKDRTNCFLCVNGDTLRWREGVAIGWDDNVPHKVSNDTDEERVIIYMDVPVKTNSRFVNNMSSFMLQQMKDSQMIKDEVLGTEVLVSTHKDINIK